MYTLKYHRDPAVRHINCLPPRAYFVPFEDEASAKSKPREKSPAYFDMCGEWDFRWYPRAEDALSDLEKGTQLPEKIDLPSCWQMYFGRGYDVPQYTNFNYPFPLDPPHVPDEIPAGLYSRSFFLSARPAAILSVSAAASSFSPVVPDNSLRLPSFTSDTLTLWSYHLPLVPISARSKSSSSTVTGTSKAFTSSLVPSG